MTERLAGEWWLPDNADTRVPGWLVAEDGGRMHLDLIGTLDTSDVTAPAGWSGPNGGGAGVYQLIHGLAGGKSFTLLDSFQTRASIQLPAQTTGQTVRVGRAVEGAHLDDTHLGGFVAVSFQLEGMVEWIADPGVGYTRTESPGGAQHVLTVTIRADEEIAGPDGSRLTFRHTPRISAEGVARTVLAQDYTVTLTAGHPGRIDDLIDSAGDVQDLVTVGMGSPAAFREVHVFHPDVRIQLGEKTVDCPLRLRAEWTVRPPSDSKRPSPHDAYFTHADLGGASGVTRWLQVAHRHGHSLGRAMAVRCTEHMFVSDRLLNYAASLEAFDQVHHPDPDPATGNHYAFTKRLGHSIQQAGPTFTELVETPAAWIEAMHKARNDIAHHRPGTDDGATHHYLAESAYWLYVLCLLQETQAPPAVFDRIAGHPQYQWLRQQLSAILASEPGHKAL